MLFLNHLNFSCLLFFRFNRCVTYFWHIQISNRHNFAMLLNELLANFNSLQELQFILLWLLLFTLVYYVHTSFNNLLFFSLSLHLFHYLLRSFCSILLFINKKFNCLTLIIFLLLFSSILYYTIISIKVLHCLDNFPSQVFNFIKEI